MSWLTSLPQAARDGLSQDLRGKESTFLPDNIDSKLQLLIPTDVPPTGCYLLALPLGEGETSHWSLFGWEFLIV